MKAPEKFKQEVINSLTSILAQSMDRICEIMANQIKRNQIKDNGQQSTVLTVKPAIRLEMDQNFHISIRSRIDCDEKYRDIYTDEREYDPNQGDLELFPSAKDEVPAKEEFYERVCCQGMTPETMDAYFSASPYHDYEHYASESSNKTNICKIMEDDQTREDFCALVLNTVEAMTDCEDE